jgi:hypothetical protein
VKGQRERLRLYLRERGVNTHLIEEPPAVAAPVKAVEGDRRDTWTKVIDLDEAGLASVAKELLSINREEERLKLRIESAKEAHTEHISGIKAQIGKLSDRKREIEREDETGKRTLTREAVVRIDWGTDEEVWLAADTGEELERRPIKKGTQRIIPGAVKPADQAPVAPPADGALPVIPAGAPSEGTPPTDGANAASAHTAPPAADKPKPPPLTKENVETALVELVGTLGPEETITTTEATDRIAAKWGIEAGQALGQFVKLAGRKAGEKGLIRFFLEGGAERVGKMPAKPLDEPAATVLAEIRKAGPEGVRRSDLGPTDSKAIDDAVSTLLERGAIAKNGKRGPASRLVAKEHAPTNGAGANAAEAQA